LRQVQLFEVAAGDDLKASARDYFTKLMGLYKNLNYAAAGSNDFQRIAKSIEHLDGSVPTISAKAATPRGAAAEAPAAAAPSGGAAAAARTETTAKAG
jgi:hypothetical protein